MSLLKILGLNQSNPFKVRAIAEQARLYGDAPARGMYLRQMGFASEAALEQAVASEVAANETAADRDLDRARAEAVKAQQKLEVKEVAARERQEREVGLLAEVESLERRLAGLTERRDNFAGFEQESLVAMEEIFFGAAPQDEVAVARLSQIATGLAGERLVMEVLPRAVARLQGRMESVRGELAGLR